MPTLARRGDGVSFWETVPGVVVRYAILLAIAIGILLFVVIGRSRANRRLAQGQPLRSYQRWLVRGEAASRARAQARYNYYAGQHPPPRGPPQAYPMEDWAPPPPAYGSADVPPPTYQPPTGGSKVAADQTFAATARAGESSAGGNGVAAPEAAAGRTW